MSIFPNIRQTCVVLARSGPFTRVFDACTLEYTVSCIPMKIGIVHYSTAIEVGIGSALWLVSQPWTEQTA